MRIVILALAVCMFARAQSNSFPPSGGSLTGVTCNGSGCTFTNPVSMSATVTAPAFVLTALSNPSAPVITTAGTGGSSTWTYKIVAVDAWGNTTAASSAGSTTAGNATLSASNYNILTFSAVTGAVKYLIYRTAHGTSPSTDGLIAATTASPFNDTGVAGAYAGDGTTAPTVNSTTIGRSYNTLTDFGAACDGQTDDTTAISTAIWSSIASGKPLYIPPTVQGCAINSSISFKAPRGLELYGAGSRLSWLKWTGSTFTFDGTNAMISFTESQRLNFHGFAIKNPSLTSASASPQKDVLTITVSQMNMDDVWVYGGQQLFGIHLTASTTVVMRGVRSELNHTGLYTNGVSSSLTCIQCGFTNNQANEINLFGASGADGYRVDSMTFIESVMDEGGSTINLGPYSRYHFIDSTFFSGNAIAYALSLRNVSGGGGTITFDGGYLGVWDSSVSSNGGGLNSGSSGSGTLIFNGTRIRSRSGAKAIYMESGSNYVLNYNNTVIVGTQDDAAATAVFNSGLASGANTQQVCHATYSFAVDGGATSTITPVTNCVLPANAVITNVALNSTTALTSGGAATIAVGTTAGSSSSSLLAATAYSSFTLNGFVQAIPVPNTASTWVKTSAKGKVSVTIAGAAVTAGVIEVYVYYYVSAT